jgi:hypothetical protein
MLAAGGCPFSGHVTALGDKRRPESEKNAVPTALTVHIVEDGDLVRGALDGANLAQSCIEVWAPAGT